MPRVIGVRSTADIFGLVTEVGGPLEVAQHWERISPVVDVVLPMTYPSHYPRGHMGLRSPNAEPYKVINAAISRARERDKKLGVTTPEHVRPWLQAFSLGKPEYGAAELEAQKKAVYDAGYDGWVMWNPGSIYDVYMPALEKRLHYRMVDVSTIKELGRRWFPQIISKQPPKKDTHRALDDIRDSIDELRFYRAHVFTQITPPARATTEPGI